MMLFTVRHNIQPGEDGLTTEQPIECSDDEEDVAATAAAIDAEIAKLTVSHSSHAVHHLRC
jgi:hypothetical protein